MMLIKSGKPRMVIVLFALVSIALMACGGGGGGGGGGGSTEGPQIALNRDSIDFGYRVIGETVERAVMVENTGTKNLNISFTDPGDGFSVEGTCLTLEPGASCNVVVQFTPTEEKSYSTNFSINSNSLSSSSVPISVTGEGKGLKVTINKLDKSDFSTSSSLKLIVSVTKPNNEPVTGLEGSNFAVYEDDADESVDIESFSNGVSSPLSVALVLDYSGSIDDYKADVENSAKAFINMLDLTADEAAVIKFARDYTVMQDFTSEIGELLAAVDAAPVLQSGTMFYTTVHDAVDMVARRLVIKQQNRGLVVVVSDGYDFGGFSDDTLQAVIDQAWAEGVAVYTIGYGEDLQVAVMQELADDTGGHYLEAPSSAELEAAYIELIEILSNLYQITYMTSKLPDSYVQVTVKVDANIGGVDQEGIDTGLFLY